MRKIIFGLSILLVITVYFLVTDHMKKKAGNKSDIIDKHGNINHVFSPAFRAPTSAIFSTISVLRPANVPLTPFKSPLKIHNVLHDGLPDFLLYKTKFLSPVVDQGICGSCWAFSITNMLSDRISVTTGGKFKKLLSTQQLLGCYNPDEGCIGQSPEDALEWMSDRKYKLNTSTRYPYKQHSNSEIEEECIDSDGVSVEPGTIKSLVTFIEEEEYDPFLLKENIRNMKTELYQNGPFFAAITVYDDFYQYNGKGVYKHDVNAEVVGGHAIEVIGYCNAGVDTRKNLLDSGEGYWICRNSWGSNWPIESNNKGFFIIKMGTNESGIESRVAVADASLSLVGYKGNNIAATRYVSFKNFVDSLPADKKNSYVD